MTKHPSDIKTLNKDQMVKYLDALGISQSTFEQLNRKEQLLTVLHRAHTERLAFSTLYFHQGNKQSETAAYIPSDITLEHAFSRIVQNKQGGTCLSLNLLFAALLKTLQFEVYAHRAHVAWGKSQKHSVATHRFSTVNIQDAIYLADVGFGGPGPRDLLNIFDKDGKFNSTVQGSGLYQYQFGRDSDGHIVLFKVGENNQKRAVYAFDLNLTFNEDAYQHPSQEVEQGLDDFFKSFLFTTKPYLNGRLMLLDQVLSYKSASEDESYEAKVEISTESLYNQSLTELFDISFQNSQFKRQGKLFHEKPSASFHRKSLKDKHQLVHEEEIPTHSLNLGWIRSKFSL